MGFSYAYDNLSRLTQADNFLGWNNFSDVSYGVYNSSYTYDKQGNIKYLSLTEDVEKLSLSMTYSGNQLQRINDWTAADPDGEPDYYSMFTDYSNTPNAQYTYNKNDAMTSDPYKSAQFSYSDWGILRQVSVPAIDGTVDYKYSATGEKAALPA
jgi:hypothetical protein